MSASCRVVRRHLDALVDGELDTTVQVEFETHLTTCTICREHAAFSKTVKKAVKQELGGVKAPEHLRLRVLTAVQSAPLPGSTSISARGGGMSSGGRSSLPLDESPASEESAPASEESAPAWSAGAAPRGRTGLRVWMLPARYAVPAAAAAVIVIALGARTDDGDADDAAMAVATVPLFEDVVRRHSSEHPAEVAGPPQQMVGWFRGKLEFPVRPVEFGQADAHLVGARLSNVREREAAAFYYEVRGHRVTVMVFERPPEPFGGTRVSVHGRDLYYRQVRGYTVPVVQHDGLTYAFTGDLDSQSMIQLAASAHLAQ